MKKENILMMMKFSLKEKYSQGFTNELKEIHPLSKRRKIRFSKRQEN
jgi:hypothetical protein